MEQEKEKLERFISAVEATTNQQVRAIENDAENECANILAEAQKMLRRLSSASSAIPRKCFPENMCV